MIQTFKRSRNFIMCYKYAICQGQIRIVPKKLNRQYYTLLKSDSKLLNSGLLVLSTCVKYSTAFFAPPSP